MVFMSQNVLNNNALTYSIWKKKHATILSVILSISYP